MTAAKESFLQGSDWAYLAGIVAIIIGGAIVFFKFPKMDEEKRLLALYQDEDLDLVS
jgi:DHA2 family multidrug resistance protein-like MFS transporter